ncbi:hypothetical protein V757_00430 [Pelistega indica]|uniref:Glycerophosphoryl diester phosphodiesterase membrane domain-containing protein n=1 Tax=Pelistega indica TaxID=1414851 RepID=V8G974_9BURK|nr:hypothetical protein [Pelistega indica]ETD73079.1 hypothetical protein V757_00430 [Pelistega indica]
MPLIHSHKPTIAFHWIKEGFSLLLKQFIPLSLLFVIVSLAFSIGTMLPLIGIFIALISLPITQMILFNAGYGIRLRGRLQLSDISQKIRSQQTILRLFGATLINFVFIYTILTITLPSIPIAIDDFMALSSEEMAKVILQTYTFSAMLMPVFCVSVYMLLTIWVYPLISWEDSRVIPAFKNSFRASMANALSLNFFICYFLLYFYARNFCYADSTFKRCQYPSLYGKFIYNAYTCDCPIFKPICCTYGNFLWRFQPKIILFS